MTSNFPDFTGMICDEATLTSITSAMQDADDPASLALLNNALSRWRHDSRLWFLRGAIHAGQHRRDDARADFVQAIRLAPEFDIARFMLGILELHDHRIDDAMIAWGPLDRLPDDNPLRVFRNGLIELVQGRFDTALKQLERGMALNRSHPLIDSYVRAIIESVNEMKGASASERLNTETEETGGSHLLLSGYLDNSTRH
ncbi:tetratricopeptide repeat protein [Burkholderia cepacia]|uniref:Tetratricopeptide repeat family protein n=1 Tax=Burkholderia cepacia TaxID=292 RepID=A0AA88Z2Z4_BURCE|nr:tetratricopeptide repeat protein [Burkholderia cepacia]KGB99764.1 tetratricopeptide repeat family protein [Burkholderia cepacia]